MRYILLAITLLLSISLSSAQEAIQPEQDRVILKSRTQFEGEIIEVSKRKVVIKVGVVPFTFHKNDIASIYYQGKVISLLNLDRVIVNKRERKKEIEIETGYKLEPEKDMAKRGFYNVTYSTFQFRGSGDFGYNGFGFGVSNTFGYQIDQYTGLGIGIGYHTNTKEIYFGNIVPLFVEYRGYLSDNKVSTYYSFAYGLSFGTRLGDSLDESFSTKPGTYIYPAIGFKSGSDKSSIMVDIGVRFSEVTYSYSQIFGFGGTCNKEEIIYNRGLILRIGVML